MPANLPGRNVVSIHQPNFLPYPGLFAKIAASDRFVIYDAAQYVKGEYHNRNRLIINGLVSWVTIPVSGRLGQRINEVTIRQQDILKTWSKIAQSYSRCRFFGECEALFRPVFQDAGESLSALSIDILVTTCRALGISAEIVKLSDTLGTPDSRATDALIEICRAESATVYLSGAGGKNYLEEKKFAQSGMQLCFQEYYPTPYPQRGLDSFQPHLAILDMIFNIGVERSTQIIRESANCVGDSK